MVVCNPALDLPRLIRALSDPAAYPHPVDTVRVLHTHISCVFLAGDYAYKIKKPVDFGFLDYRAADRRHFFCEQELLINRRLCADIYLDVVPITAVEDRLVVGGEGFPVEWAVQMRRLRDRDMLPARLALGTLGRLQIERIAQRLAAFHAQAASDARIRAFGAPEEITRTIAMTLNVMDSNATAPWLEAPCQAIRLYLEGFLQDEAGLLRLRMQEGRTRDCHGDLRLQNICLDPRYSDGIQIFDGIEFNVALRCIDTAADLAYLAMDLDLAGRADLGAILVDAYEGASGDTTLRRVLPFYRAYRACVRGNIALLAAAEPEIPMPAREAQRSLAGTAYDLAWSYSRRRERPALLLTTGFSGSGKSALAEEVCRRLPAVLLSSDRVRKEMAGIPATMRLESAGYTLTQRAAVYAEMRRRARGHLERGENVLLDATFLSALERAAAGTLAAECGAGLWLLECRCPDAMIRRRLRERTDELSVSDADLAVYEAQRSCNDPISLEEARCCIRVDTDRPISEAAHQALDGLLLFSREGR
ncbi:MAG TPA: AAA family ATPase [Chthonomonadaceae bacterium]|nr:AAA family ATPase [Chthonomonadaceae bacterium]